MRKLFSLLAIGGVISAAALPAFACGGGGGCGMGGGGGMGGRGGYYGGARSRASTKVLSGGPRVAQSGVSARRGPAVVPKPAATLADAKKRAATQALRTVAKRRKAATPPLYTCPMHPQVQWTKPTDCPICGMKLKLKQAKAGAAKRAPAADDEHAGMDMDEMGDMSGMDMRDDTGGMAGMCCGC